VILGLLLWEGLRVEGGFSRKLCILSESHESMSGAHVASNRRLSMKVLAQQEPFLSVL
jgi:hypothetical protein